MLVWLLLSLLSVVSCNELHDFTFLPPFTKVDKTNGKRFINETFDTGGDAEVMKNFVRLTTDRQSKHGYIWSSQHLNRDEFSAILKFRISGQGKKWYGDGIGFWITNLAHHRDGDNHGFTDQYRGVGVILDTFFNPEHRGGHKDITIQVNDGTKTLDSFEEEDKIGCEAKYIRYHEGNAAFDPIYSSARLKIRVKGRSLKVDISGKEGDEWHQCYAGELKSLPVNWAIGSSIGITAATGSLADNHDIISLEMFEEEDDFGLSMSDSQQSLHRLGKHYGSWIKSDSCDTACKIALLEKQMNDFRVGYEHKVTALKESTQNTIGKLKEAEEQNQHKIEELEHAVSQMVESKVSIKMAEVGTVLTDKIHSKISQKVGNTGSGWRFPFFLLITVLGGLMLYSYKQYQRLRKTHLL